MFRTVFPSIIRSLRLYIQHEVYVIQIVLTACWWERKFDEVVCLQESRRIHIFKKNRCF